jgi:anthranilate 1,2-dioxygenase small subunit
MPDSSYSPINIDTNLLQRIDTLNRRYGHIIDENQLEDWPAFFTENARYMVTTRQNREANMPVGLIQCENRAMMEDRISALRIANLFEPHRYRHLIDPPIVTDINDNEYSLQTSFACFRTVQGSATEIFCTGKYLDRIIDDGGQLLFKERIIVCDSERIDTLIVIPL